MKTFVETINITDGEPLRLAYHNRRMSRTIAHFYPGAEITDLCTVVAPSMTAGTQKCRVVYSDHIENVTYEEYQMREVKSLMLVDGADIDYAYKSTDRDGLNLLRQKRGDADEILIVKHGEITDTSYTNVAFWDGSEWFTPVHPLLHGTCRASLIERGILHEQMITFRDLDRFSKVSLINAMMNLGEMEIPMSEVIGENT
jgi:4-amino-4-deoxychorismate lyase